MAERARPSNGRGPISRFRPLPVNSPTQENPFAVVVTRESLLRLALSFVLALALWLYVTGKQDPDVAVALPQPLPIQVAELSGDYVMTRDLGAAHVTYRTASPQTQVSSANFRTYIDLLNARPGIHRNVRVVCESDPGITCVSVKPRVVAVSLDVREQIHVPVVAHIIGKPPAGYYTQSPQFFPSTVTVNGPRTVVSQITAASVGLNVSGLTSSLDGPYRPSLVGTQGVPLSGTSRLNVEPVQITVHMGIKSLSSFKPLPVVLSPFKGQPRSGYGLTGVTISPPEVTVQGSPQRLRQLSSISTRALNISGKRNSFSTRVPLLLPRGVAASTSSVTVHAQIQRLALVANTSLEIPVTIQGMSRGIVANARPAKEVVTVVGPASTIRQVATQIRAIINVAPYGTGTYVLTPDVTVPPSFHLANVYPGPISVTLTSR